MAKTKSKEQICAFFIMEGQTEEQFYKEHLIPFLKLSNPASSQIIIKYKCLKGIGNAQNKIKPFILKKVSELSSKSKNRCRFLVFLCYDSDVFELGKHPPVQWNKLEEDLEKLEITQIFHLKAVRTIEDWFIKDPDSIRNYLRLPSRITVKTTGISGLEELQRLFKLAGKSYSKGVGCQQLVQHLDCERVILELEKELTPLLVLFGYSSH